MMGVKGWSLEVVEDLEGGRSLRIGVWDGELTLSANFRF